MASSRKKTKEGRPDQSRGAIGPAGRKLQDCYQKLEKIGEGSCGVVFKARRIEDGRIVAIKKVHISYDDGQKSGCFGVPATALREIATLSTVAPHPSVINLYESLMEKERIYLVCEYLDRDLRCHLEKTGPFCEEQTKLYSWQVFHGLAHCHKHRIAHRDVKPQNILVDLGTDTIKLCDFSLARPVLSPSEPQTQRVASLWYRSPELLLGGSAQGLALDSWSSGCVLGELLKGRPLFPGGSEIETLFCMFKRLGTPAERQWRGLNALEHWSQKFPKFKAKANLLDDDEDDASESEDQRARTLGTSAASPALDLLRALLRYDPKLRLACSLALSTPFFHDLNIVRFLPTQQHQQHQQRHEKRPNTMLRRSSKEASSNRLALADKDDCRTQALVAELRSRSRSRRLGGAERG